MVRKLDDESFKKSQTFLQRLDREDAERRRDASSGPRS